jgi:hypothetical protein
MLSVSQYKILPPSFSTSLKELNNFILALEEIIDEYVIFLIENLLDHFISFLLNTISDFESFNIFDIYIHPI